MPKKHSPSLNATNLEEEVIVGESEGFSRDLRHALIGASFLLMVALLTPVLQDWISHWHHIAVDPTFARYAATVDHKSLWDEANKVHLVTFKLTPAILLINGEEYLLIVDENLQGSGRMWCNTRSAFVGSYLCNSDRIAGEPPNVLIVTICLEGQKPQRNIFRPTE